MTNSFNLKLKRAIWGYANNSISVEPMWACDQKAHGNTRILKKKTCKAIIAHQSIPPT